jgi:hypothetical protein
LKNIFKNKKILIACTFLLFLLVIAIFSHINIPNSKKSQAQVNNTKAENSTPTKVDSTPPKVIDNKIYAPYTGEEVTNDVLNQVPYMAVIENDRLARPQYGLSQADIMFETMAEGGIPRFMGIFQKNQPTVIGPIRSARPYFLDLSLEYGLPFAHCGGSQEALDRIKSEGLMSLDEMYNGNYYWRDKTVKTSERSLRTSSEKITALIKQKNYVRPTTNFLKFDKPYWDNPALSSAANVNLKLNISYSTGYTYKDGVYYKSMDGVASTDQGNGNSVTAKNIVIQITNIKAINNYRLVIDLVGSGTGYVISNGKFTKMNWSRKNISSPTTLTDDAGKPITLSPGNTWWHIIDNYANIDIK